MKKYIVILITIFYLCGMFSGCGYFTSSETPTPDTSPSPTATSDPTVTIHPEYGELPVYQPGSIELVERESDDFPYERKYRLVYYEIVGPFMDLVDEEDKPDFYEWAELDSEETNYGEYSDEMLLVSMVKRFDITREEFDNAVEEFIERFGDGASEWNEVPNADIIYTFDNEIINEYYRYE